MFFGLHIWHVLTLVTYWWVTHGVEADGQRCDKSNVGVDVDDDELGLAKTRMHVDICTRP